MHSHSFLKLVSFLAAFDWPDIWSCKCKFFCVYRPYKKSISKEMNNDNDLNLHSMNKFSDWFRYSDEVGELIIRKSQPQDISTDNCNCRNKCACPLQNKCMSKDIVYKATINIGNTQDTKNYIGMTSNTFKERYRNHIKSFTRNKYSNETELSKHVWHLKQNRFHHEVVYNKKEYFLHGRIQKMSFMFGGK